MADAKYQSVSTNKKRRFLTIAQIFAFASSLPNLKDGVNRIRPKIKNAFENGNIISRNRRYIWFNGTIWTRILSLDIAPFIRKNFSRC